LQSGVTQLSRYWPSQTTLCHKADVIIKWFRRL
jgi:hypothetical protein